MRKFLAIALTLFCGLALPARTIKKEPKVDYSQFQKRLSKDDQMIHALDRLTFGPRRGDVEAVRKMGLKKWIDLQLHPERIRENPELAKKLEPLESLRMTQAETASAYPTPQMIRAVALGRQALPEEPVARAAVERMAHRFKVKKGDDGNAPMEPAVPLNELLTADQIKTLRSGTVDQKRELVESIPDDKMDDVVIAMPQPMRNQLMAAATPVVRRKLVLANQPQGVVFYDLAEAKLYRAILSNRQLDEELTDFWFNHFNVFFDKGADRFMVTAYERDAIRPHVLGHFRELLEATASSPAMLFYLDNWESVAPPPANAARKQNNNRPQRGLNENYARELMELHTLGVDGGYTQKDIIEVARCFTGWTIRNPQQGGGFFFNDRVHDKGEKTVLGVTIPAGGGKEDAEKVLDILANHPSTAKFISKKLAQRFVADDPPPELLDKMAKTFTKTHGDIREVMKTMVESKEFFSAGAYRAKVKDSAGDDRERDSGDGRAGGFCVSAGTADRDVGRAVVSQDRADRIFERERGMGQLGVTAGADEFRAGADAEQGGGRKGGCVAVCGRSAAVGAAGAVPRCGGADATGDCEGFGGSKRQEPERADGGAGDGISFRVAGFSAALRSQQHEP